MLCAEDEKASAEKHKDDPPMDPTIKAALDPSRSKLSVNLA